ncbi:MAG: DUF3568 family protein [Nitrospinae bacterium]|nr:DUF3568 family protein [Nitrospinota bacterium]
MKKILALLLAAQTLTGCFWLVAGGAGAAGAYVWSHGNLTRHYQQPFETTWEGTMHALRVMDLPVVDSKKDKYDGVIKAKMPGGRDKLIVSLERWTDRETRVTVRAGALGDKAFSERAHEEIAKALR